MDGLVAEILTIAFALASAGTLFWLFQRHIGGRALLHYEPRRPVPWNFVAPLVVMTPTATTLLMSFEASRTAVEAASSEVAVSDIWSQAGALLLMSLAFLTILSIAFGADARDLGVSGSLGQAARDVGIGVVAFLAILLPVYALQYILTLLFEPQNLNPLIEELQINSTREMLAAAAATAVVSAPLFEETTFRLIFQGWLERQEDAALGFRKKSRAPISEPAVGEASDSEAPTSSGNGDALESPPVMGVLPGLPHGWAPVLVSGALFAMAHLGHGVAPVSLFPMGVILGYLYQRTHRLLPSVVCHALFNGFSMIMLWLSLAEQSS